MKKLGRILFICVENAYRSQMAEGFFNAFSRGKAIAKKHASHIDPYNPFSSHKRFLLNDKVSKGEFFTDLLKSEGAH